MKIPRTEILLAGVFSLIGFSLGNDGGKRELMSKNMGRGITVEEYRRGERQIREAERKGEVSKKDADKRLIEMRKAITSVNKEEKKKGHDERGVKYRAAEEKIWTAVKDGKLSEEGAQKRLGAIKKKNLDL